MRAIEDTALAFDRAARSAEVPYALVGGFAVSAWGQPRTTSDVDALVDLAPERVAGFVNALAAEGLSAAEADFHDVLRVGGHVTVFDEGSSFHVDAKPCRSAGEREQVKNAADVAFRGASLRFARAEDTVVYKLVYGTPQDLNDAATILARQAGKLDEASMMALAIRLNVAPDLKSLRERVEKARGGQ